MSQYRLIASDLDGTLLLEDMTLSPENERAIHALAQQGVEFVPSSGRAFYEIPEVLREHPDIRYYLSANGSMITDKVTGERLLLCMTQDVLGQALDILKGYDMVPVIRCDGRSHLDEDRDMTEYIVDPVSRYHWDFLSSTGTPHPDFETFFRSQQAGEMIFGFFLHPGENEECRKELEATGQLQVACPSPYLIEIVSKEASKGNALRRLADWLGLDLAQVIAVGDSDNDRTALEVAGLGLAMANAGPALKAVADGVACANTEHIAKYILEQYILG